MSTDLVRNSRLIAVVVALAAGHLGCHRHTHAVVVTAPPPRPVVVAQAQTAVVVDEDGDGDGDVVIEDFNEPLANYGVWVYDPRYGRVWQPAADMSGPDFVPYGSDGDWVVNDDGDWVFQSRYHAQWGWATYHYGRWVQSDSYGWVWMPGRRWAPAWVEWRYGGGYVGWRPLAPRGVVVVDHSHWVFVDRVHIGHPGVMSYRVPHDHWHVAYQSATPIVEVRGHSRWRAGPSVSELRGSGVSFTSVHVAAPAQGYVRAQGRVAIEAAAERRASGRVSATPQIRSGAAAPDARYNAQVRPVDPMAPGARQVATPMPAPAPQPGPGARVEPMQLPSSRPDPVPAARHDPSPARPDPGTASRPAHPIPTPRPDPGAASRPANPIPTPRPDPGTASRPAHPIPTPRPDPGTASRPASPAPMPAPAARPAKPATPAPAPRPSKSNKKRK